MRVEQEELEEVRGVIQDILSVGKQRAWFHDLRYGFQQLTDIALKALSPGINDPTTAIMAIHATTKLSREVLLHATHHELRANEAGELKLIFREQWLDRLLMETFWQVMHYGNTDFMVVETLLEQIGQLAAAATQWAHFEIVSECIEGLINVVDLDAWSAPQQRRMSRTIRDVETLVAQQRHAWKSGDTPSPDNKEAWQGGLKAL
jgi:uncharacterized membrane protein